MDGGMVGWRDAGMVGWTNGGVHRWVAVLGASTEKLTVVFFTCSFTRRLMAALQRLT